MASLNDHIKLLVHTIVTPLNPPIAMTTTRTGGQFSSRRPKSDPGSRLDERLIEHQHFNTLAYLASLPSRAILHI